MNTQAYWEGYAEACLTRGINPMALQKQAGMGDYMPSKEQLMAFAKDPRTIGGAAGAGLGAIGGGLYGGGQGALMGGLGGAALGAGGGQLYDMYGGSGDGGGAAAGGSVAKTPAPHADSNYGLPSPFGPMFGDVDGQSRDWSREDLKAYQALLDKGMTDEQIVAAVRAFPRQMQMAAKPVASYFEE